MNLNLFNRYLKNSLGISSILVLFCLGGYGCSTGASAPPVSLPAPVTGRLTVSSPDETTGVALVSGDDGTVPAGSLVQATNESKTSALLIPVLDLFPAAEAQTTFPDICSQAFHACAFADATGSFEMQLTASEDDSIAVGVLDSSGNTISTKTHHSVPHNVRFFARPVLSDAILDNTLSGDDKLYALMGSSLTDPKGLVAVVDLPTKTRTLVPFAGTHPSHIAVLAETRKAIVLDDDNGFIASVDLTSNNFDVPSSTLNIALPKDLAANPSGSAVYVSTGNSANVIKKVDAASLASLGGLTNIDLQTIIPGVTNLETGTLDVASFTTTVTFDLVAFAGNYSIGGVTTPAIGLMDGSTMTIMALIPLPAGTIAHDIALDATQNKILVSDPGNNQILVYQFSTTYPGGSTSLTLSGPVPDPNGFVVAPRNIVVDSTDQLAFITAKDGNDTRPDSVLTLDLATDQLTAITPIGLGPTDVAFDAPQNKVYVSTFKSRSITVWSVPQLIP